MGSLDNVVYRLFKCYKRMRYCRKNKYLNVVYKLNLTNLLLQHTKYNVYNSTVSEKNIYFHHFSLRIGFLFNDRVLV